jgi:hypothetical protein
LQQTAIELDRVIVGDGPLVLEAADALEIGWGRRMAPCRLGMRRRMGEAGVIAREKPVEHALRLGERTGPSEAEFGDEPILKRAKEAFDAAFPFGGGGRNPADAEFLKGPADLRSLDGSS